MLGLARELDTMGHEATVLAPMDTSRTARSAAALAGLHVIDLGPSVRMKANGSVAPVALGPRASFRALKALNEERPDVLHIHEPLAPGASYACLALCKTPMVGTFHRSGGSALYTLLGPLARMLADRLQVRCAVSDEARSTAQRALGGSYELIGNGIDLTRFEDARPWPTEGPTVMFVGRHETRKGLGVLLEAFSSANVPGAVCWIAGEGPESVSLREKFPPSSSLVWLGRIDDLELARRLRGSHVACFPSLGGESFGVVLLEAMAASSAILASDLPGYRSVAGGHALFVRPGDVSGLRSGLEAVLTDAVHGERASSPEALEAGSSIAESFSISHIAARYLEVYEQAVSTSKGR